MQPAIDLMKQKLEMEASYFEDLLATVDAERKVLLSGGHDKLAGLSEKKLALCHDLAQVQNERQELAKSIMGKGQGPAKLIELSERLPKSERAGFRAALHNLDALSQRVQKLNELNQLFVRDALDMVEHLMGIVTQTKDPGTYSPQGGHKRQDKPRILTREV